jgi:hypothetical protein
MSRDVPEHIGELSRYALQQAIDRVDRELAGAPQELRDAVSVIRLVTDVPRRAPWYGAIIDSEDSSVSVGVMMRNAFEAVGDSIDAPTDRGLETHADHWFTKLYLSRWRRGRREYRDYLEHLTDPARFERECAERRLSAEQAAAIHRSAVDWLATEAPQRP